MEIHIKTYYLNYFMKISEISIKTRAVDTEGKIITISQPREVNTRYGPTQVASALIEDDTGSISLTLWGKQIEEVKPGDSVKIEGGYVTEFKGEPQISVSKKGNLTILK